MTVWLPAVSRSKSPAALSANADGIDRRVIAATATRERRTMAARIERLLGRWPSPRAAGRRSLSGVVPSVDGRIGVFVVAVPHPGVRVSRCVGAYARAFLRVAG